MAYTVSLAGLSGGRTVADNQHAKGITHRDLKPEVRLLGLDTTNGTDPTEHTLDEGNTR